MSLWAESLSNSCLSASNKAEQIQETLRHLSMPVPLSWWESCLKNESEISQFAEIICEICGDVVLLDGWNNYGLFVALAFAELDSIQPYKYSIDEYRMKANKIIKNNSTVCKLAHKVNIYLKKQSKIPTLETMYLLKLFDLLNLKNPQISPTDCKLHLACWNGNENPIDEYLAGTFEEWQSWQNKQNFKRKYIISLIQLPSNDCWLLGGVFQSLKCEYVEKKEEYQYQTKELPEFKEFTGRLILSFKRTMRQSYLNAEKWVNEVKVLELKARKIAVEKFPGYNKVLISKNKLDTIVTKNISTWESALANVAGVYLITDTANGKNYVGSATGDSGIWQRWCEYSQNGHGGNKELKKILHENGENYSNNFQYSILEIADTHSSNEDILTRESFWKDVLCSRIYGYNGN